jgi:hypothetical protein
MRESTPTTYIFTALTSGTTTLEPCALNAEFQHFILDFIKFPYFVDITQRGDRGEREGDITYNFMRLILILH